MVQNTAGLPGQKPRYLMGVGYPLDIVVCVALGVDMFDCVYPTRTARFGVALTRKGTLRLKGKPCAHQRSIPVQRGCPCLVCRPESPSFASRAALHVMFKDNSELACQLLTQHNIVYMMTLMRSMRSAILEGDEAYGKFLRDFLIDMFYAPDDDEPSVPVSFSTDEIDEDASKVPQWVKDALTAAGVADLVFPLRR